MRRSSAVCLFLGAMLTAAGYGSTFLLEAHFRSLGGNGLEAGTALFSALIGTFVGVPIVGWWSARVPPPRLAAIAAVAMAVGYSILLFAPADAAKGIYASGFLIGLGWGMFYLSAPMTLSERVRDSDRGIWFTRFSVFQMTGICGGPAVIGAAIASGRADTRTAFIGVIVAALAASGLFWFFGSREPVGTKQMAIRPWMRDLRHLLGTQARWPIAMAGLGGCVFSGIMTFQASLTSGTRAVAGQFFLAHAATAILARIVLAKPLARAPQVPITALLLATMTAGVVCLFGIHALPDLHRLAAVLTGLGYGLAYPVIQAWAVNLTEPRFRHSALCWFVVSYFVGIFGFPVIGEWVLFHHGTRWFIAAVVALAAFECAIACAVWLGQARRPARVPAEA